MSAVEKEELKKIHGKKLSRLEPQLKDYTTHTRLESLDLEVSELKLSLLDLHDKVSSITSMLENFIKEIKGMIVGEVEVKEEVKNEANVKEPSPELKRATPRAKDATPPSAKEPAPKKRKTRSKK